MKPALRAANLRLQRRDHKGDFQLDVPELLLEPGERLAILGSNGAGKSTLVKILFGLYQVLSEQERSTHSVWQGNAVSYLWSILEHLASHPRNKEREPLIAPMCLSLRPRFLLDFSNLCKS